MSNKKSYNRILVAAILVVCAVIGGAFYFIRPNTEEVKSNLGVGFYGDGVGSGTSAAEVPLQSGDALEYRDPDTGVSFQYPKQYTISHFDEDDGTQTILLRDSQDSSLQISLTPYDDSDTDITLDRIQSDVPDMNISSAREITISGVKGLEFQNDEGGFIEHHIWFIADTYLIQIFGSPKDKAVLQTIAATWK